MEGREAPAPREEDDLAGAAARRREEEERSNDLAPAPAILDLFFLFAEMGLEEERNLSRVALAAPAANRSRPSIMSFNIC
jgi:hypothetical protein